MTKIVTLMHLFIAFLKAVETRKMAKTVLLWSWNFTFISSLQGFSK